MWFVLARLGPDSPGWLYMSVASGEMARNTESNEASSHVVSDFSRRWICAFARVGIDAQQQVKKLTLWVSEHIMFVNIPLTKPPIDLDDIWGQI